MNINDESVKITITMKDKDNLIANATVSVKTEIYGWITIKNFCIWKSPILNDRIQEQINITPPSFRGVGKFHPLIFVEDEKLWHALESRIYDAFHLERSKKSMDGNNEGVDPEDIPF